MAEISYSEKLQNPLWQKKRLEVLQRDEFKCCLCSDKKTTLHIHHKSYAHGKMPWEYELDNFQTLCKHCHTMVEFFKKKDLVVIACKKSPYEVDYICFDVLTNEKTFDWLVFNSIAIEENNQIVIHSKVTQADISNYMSLIKKAGIF